MKKLKSWNDVHSFKDAVEYVQAHGCTWIRTTASHGQFRGPNGKTFPIQVNHLAWALVPGLKCKIKREMQDAGVTIE